MKKSSHEQRALHQELTREQQALGELVADTHAEIAKAAQQLYDGVSRHDTSKLGRSSLHVDREAQHRSGFGTPYVRTHKVPLTQAAHLPGSEVYAIEATYFEERQRRISIGSRSYAVQQPLPGVRLDLMKVSAEDAHARHADNPIFAITTNGEATHDFRRTYTAPHKTVGRPQDYQWRHADVLYYPDTTELRNDYAATYSGALTVAATVATGFAASHELDIPTEPLMQIVDTWQDMRTSPEGGINTQLAKAMPFGLAARAGASLY